MIPFTINCSVFNSGEVLWYRSWDRSGQKFLSWVGPANVSWVGPAKVFFIRLCKVCSPLNWKENVRPFDGKTHLLTLYCAMVTPVVETKTCLKIKVGDLFELFVKTIQALTSKKGSLWSGSYSAPWYYFVWHGICGIFFFF